MKKPQFDDMTDSQLESERATLLFDCTHKIGILYDGPTNYEFISEHVEALRHQLKQIHLIDVIRAIRKRENKQ